MTQCHDPPRCACVNLSQDTSSLLFARAAPDSLRDLSVPVARDVADLRAREDALGYMTPTGHHADFEDRIDVAALDALDIEWRKRLTAE